MTECYFVDCQCRSQLPVELFEAGTVKICSVCHATVRIPNSAKLKELSGDKYPQLSPIQKIQRTSQAGEPPCDGTCHGCHAVPAAFATPCTLATACAFHLIVQRWVSAVEAFVRR